MNVPKRVSERLSSSIKKFQPFLNNARARDCGEADTVTIVKDMLAEVFGYDKYNDITGEHAIRGTYCDLAIKLDGALQTLLEVKAIGSQLKESHVKQIIDYAANEGVEWVALTNGINWRVYKVHFTKPIDHELVVDIDFCALNYRNSADIELLYLWCKEGWNKSVVGEYYEQKQLLSHYYIGAIILDEPVLKEIRKTLCKIAPGVKIDTAQIKKVITEEVLKREVIDGEKAILAQSKLSKLQRKLKKQSEKTTDNSNITEEKPPQIAIKA